MNHGRIDWGMVACLTITFLAFGVAGKLLFCD